MHYSNIIGAARPIAKHGDKINFLWLSLPGDCRVTDEALLAETK